MKKSLSIVLSFILTLVLCSTILCVITSANDSDYYNLEIIKSDNGTNYSLTLSGKISANTYTLRYEDAESVLSDFEDICNFVVDEDTDKVSYDGLILQNCAPKNAKYIGVYNSANERVTFVDASVLSANVEGEKLYSFAAISDTHIGAKTAESDLQNALTYFESDDDIKFTTICGDLSLAGTETNLNLYKSIVDTYTTKPVYAISGNHETNATFAPLAMDSLKSYTGQDLYYSFTYNNDVYIMLGMYDLVDNCEFAEGELQWLYETLEANRNKRCFLFMHLFPKDGSGDAVDLDLEGDMLDNVQGQVFYSLLSHYSNVIYMHGHSHQKFKIQEAHPMNTYDNIFGCHSVHIPSLAYPKYLSNSKLNSDYDASEGYVVDVYENSIVLRGRDFISGKFLPIAQYCLDTTPKEIEENTYYDSTGTITNTNSNVLKAGKTWYNSDFDKSLITKISFVKEYTDTSYDECWDATISNGGQVMVYRKGTELSITGNDNGIVANKDSSYMFTGFKNLVTIDGLELIDTTNITSIDGFFYNCNKLENVNLSALINVSVSQLNYVFYGCSAFETIDISDWDLTNVKKYNSTFQNCTLLKNVCLNEFASKNHTSVYCSGTFKNCINLINFDFSPFNNKNVYLASMFFDCALLEAVDLKNIYPISSEYTFKNCSSLEKIFISNKFKTIEKSCFENCEKLDYIFYSGTNEEWQNVTIGANNDILSSVVVHYNATGITISGWKVLKNTSDNVMYKECTECGEKLYSIEFMLGDIDGDDTYSENDYAMIIQASACRITLTEEQIIMADIDGDGAVDTFDAIALDVYMN